LRPFIIKWEDESSHHFDDIQKRKYQIGADDFGLPPLHHEQEVWVFTPNSLSSFSFSFVLLLVGLCDLFVSSLVMSVAVIVLGWVTAYLIICFLLLFSPFLPHSYLTAVAVIFTAPKSKYVKET
jgi:hypothetical protein